MFLGSLKPHRTLQKTELVCLDCFGIAAQIWAIRGAGASISAATLRYLDRKFYAAAAMRLPIPAYRCLSRCPFRADLSNPCQPVAPLDFVQSLLESLRPRDLTLLRSKNPT
jgi:hypothetical protein